MLAQFMAGMTAGWVTGPSRAEIGEHPRAVSGFRGARLPRQEDG